MELLNLDEILTIKRKITIGGVDYDVSDQSIGQMITTLQVQKLIESEGDEEELMMQIVESIKAIIPACPEEVIRRLPMRGVNAIFEFANASDKEAIEGSEREDTESEKK